MSLILTFLFMAVKLQSLALTKRIPNWVFFSKARVSSISCAMKYQNTNHEPEENQISNPTLYEESEIQLLKRNLHPDNLVSVLDTTPDLNSSLNLFKWASLQRNFRHTAETYHAMILKLGMAGKLDEMEGFCREMVREKFPGLEMTLLSLMDSFVTNNRLSEALRILKVMNLSSCKPNIGVINRLMGGLVEEKRDFKDVVFVYKEMVKSEVLPNTETLNYLLEALFESGRLDTALNQYRRMHKKGCDPNVRTFEILVNNLLVRNRVDEALVILQDMSKYRCDPNSSFYARVIPLFCGLGNLEVASRLFERMTASNMVPDSVTYEAMIRCLCDHLHMDDAITIVEDMIVHSIEPDHQVYLDLVTGLCKINKFAAARNLLEESNIFDVSLYNTLLQSCCDSGDYTVAKDLFHDMCEKNITDTTSWNIFIRFLCENIQISKALECLGRMFISSFYPESDTYSALVLAYCRTEKVANALDLFVRIRSKCYVLDSVSYAELMEHLCKKGSINEASEVFRYMSEKGCVLQSNAFNIFIEKLCTNGEINSAIKLLYSSTSQAYLETSTTTYNSIMRGLFKSGKGNHIRTILSRLIISGCDFDAETYCILIQSTSTKRRIEDSIYLFDVMLSKGLMPDSETLSRLLCCLASCSRMHAVASIVEETLVDVLDSTMYNLVVSSLWREGYTSEAKELLDVMLGKGYVPSASTHALLMTGFVCNNEALDARGDLIVRDGVSFILEEGLKVPLGP